MNEEQTLQAPKKIIIYYIATWRGNWKSSESYESYGREVGRWGMESSKLESLDFRLE